MNGAQIIYVVGLSHSGSTLLSILLGSHPQALAVGELKGLSVQNKFLRRYRKGIQSDILESRCSCGATPVLACPFWQQVEKIVRERVGFGLDEIDLSVSDVNHFRQHSQALYSAIYQVSGARQIVDSSKDIDLLRRLLQESGLAVRPIFIMRRLEGVVTSNMRKGRHWLRRLAIDLIVLVEIRYRLRGVEHLVIHYEDLATSPDTVLRSIWAWLDVPFHEAWPQWIASEHHLFAGNRMRENPNPHIQVDEAWREELSRVQKLACGVGNVLAKSVLFQRSIMWLLSRRHANHISWYFRT